MNAELATLQAVTLEKASPATRASWPPESQLSSGQITAFARARGHAVLASTRADGRPHATPADFVLDGLTLWSPAGPHALRRKNIRRLPWMSAVISQGDGPSHALLLLEGPVRETDEIRPALLSTYQDKYTRAPLATGGWLALTAERAFSFRGPSWVAPTTDRPR